MKLRTLLLIALTAASLSAAAQTTAAHFDMSLKNGQITESVSNTSYTVASQLPACTIASPSGVALRFDGYSNYVKAGMSASTISTEAMTLSVTLAAESYPMMKVDVAEETPTFATICVLQLAEGWTVELDPKTHDILDKRTDPTWPTTWFAPRLDPTKDAFKDVYSVMNNWGANHGAICYGHVGADLITLCAMLRIPVCMHNIADKDIFRPACWNAFGMDKEGADYRACANFGPIYK